ncbi:FAD-dependent monooxygenase [Actinopolyspora sp. H202]|uniref:FAD-dependent monooxygenase n=1 Tax=Actinopolyspora sp. H202 TaxID=1500456 RepID=UPI003EE6A753
MTDHEIPVLVVGGGGCGLSTSIFLSDLGVEHLLVERRETPSALPRAHYLNQRTMEIFRQHGLAAEIYRDSAPLENMSEVVWRTSLAGDGELDALDLHRMDAFGGGSTAGPYLADSPCPSTNFPQHRLEPLLHRHAVERAPESVLFGHVMEEFTGDESGVTAVVTESSTGHRFTVRARCLVAADGGRGIGDELGVEMTGEGGALDVVSVHFSADLAEWWPGDSVLMTNFVGMDGGPVSRYGMVALGPEWGLKCREWALHFHPAPDSGLDLGEEAMVDRVRQLLKLPDLDLEIHRVSNYRPEGVVASTFRVGNVFLAGDAAHRQPPATGLGLNSAIQDGHNLAWKLGAVLDGTADRRLLDTYEAERLPVARRNVSWAMYAFRNHAVAHAGLGLLPGQPLESARATIRTLFSDTPMGRTRRARAEEVFATQRVEYQAHDIEIGFAYEKGALVPDGTPPPDRDPMGCGHQPTTRPGHRLPHARLARDGEVSTHDLVGARGGFVLFTGEQGGSWRAAAERVAEDYGVSLAVVSIGEHEGAIGHDGATGHVDVDGTWREAGGIGAGGAVLVRPDNHIAWRATEDDADIEARLHDALGRVLGLTATSGAGS